MMLCPFLRQFALVVALTFSLAPARPNEWSTAADREARIARERNADALRQQRRTVIDNLLRDAKQQTGGWHSAKHLAIVLLGEWRAEEAIPVLIDNLDYKIQGVPGIAHYPSREEQYPAITALQKIGGPSVDSLILILAAPNINEDRQDNAIHIISSILGESLAQSRLTIAIQATADVDGKARLEAARKRLAHATGAAKGGRIRTDG